MTFSAELVEILNKSLNFAKSLKNEFLTPEHVLYTGLNEESVQSLITLCGADYLIMQNEANQYITTQIPKVNYVEENEPIQTEGFKALLEKTTIRCFEANKAEVEFSDLLVNMFNDERQYCCYVLKKGNLTKLHLMQVLSLK